MLISYILEVDQDVRPAIADLMRLSETDVWGPNTCMISRINVPMPARGLGVGTKLLRQILDDADAERVTLVLGPSPSDGLDFDQLVAWYQRHGFSWTRSGAMMERLPQ